MLVRMGRCLMLSLLPPLIASAAAPAAAPVADKAKEAARIESECGLKRGTITVIGDEIRLNPSTDENYKHVDCALGRLKKAGIGKLGFVGNEIDPNGILRPPIRYIVEGPSGEIAAIVKAAEGDKWTITRTATASDGVAIVQLQSGKQMTYEQASHLLQRIWKKEFGDVEFGLAPRKVGDPHPFDD